ncbi:carbohydrate ABC transporter permease [Serinibacter arcticus]|uniref:carbohydrate ABC transporter permease n=1 Tax=Serinibacter arcticus TaxID=1655435 RepID=UPI0026D397B5
MSDVRTTQDRTTQDRTTRDRSDKASSDEVRSQARRRRASIAAFYAVLILVAIVYIYPFVIQTGTSFKTDGDSTYNPLNPFPTVFSLDAYAKLAEVDFPLWFRNSVIVTFFVTIGRVLLCSAAGYALSRLHFVGKKFLLAAILAVMAVPGVVLLIPKFLILNQLGMYNTFSAMIIPLLWDATGIFIMKQYFDTIPPRSRRRHGSTAPASSAGSGRS